MVEAIVTFAIERIADAVVREASSLYGVQQGVEQLQTELKRIRCFLKDADSKQDQDERVRNCIAEIRDIAYEAEDIIDTFILKAETGSRKRVCRLIKRVTSMVIKVPYLHEIGNQIKSIQDKIGSVSTSMLTYNIKLVAEGEGSRSTNEMQRRLRRSFPHDEEDEDVIRLEASLRDVQSQLMVEEEQRRVVSIVGMGGLGKTTLAKTLYNDNHVNQHFDCHSWSFISQQFSARDVLVGILTEVASKQDKFDLVKMEEEKLLLKRIEDEVDRIVEELFSKWTLKQMKMLKEDQLFTEEEKVLQFRLERVEKAVDKMVEEQLSKLMMEQNERTKEDQLFMEEGKLLQLKLERVENEVDRMAEEQLSKMMLKQNERMKEDQLSKEKETHLQQRLQRVENEEDRMVEDQSAKLMSKQKKKAKEEQQSTEEEKLLQMRLEKVENDVDGMAEEQLFRLMLKQKKRMNNEQLSKLEPVKMEEKKIPQLRLEAKENEEDMQEEEQTFRLVLNSEKWKEEVQSFKLELKKKKWMEEVQLFKLQLKLKKKMEEVQLFKMGLKKKKMTEEVQLFKLELKQKRRMEEEQVFQLMLKQMKVEPMFYAILERMSEEKLVETLFQVLKKKRYFVVLDDIWQNEVWDSLKHAFPAKGKKGSKVLLTTRNKEVAAYADPWSSPVEPPLLTNDEAWELLSRKAFPKDILIKHGCPQEHESLGREMVKKCGGLPLAIVVLGGLLATKKTLKEWEVVQRNINAQFVLWEQHHQYGGVYGILALSYHDLPFYLKPFFLYFSQFPEDWEIHKRMLIRMWAAEGFLSRAFVQGGNEAMEDMCERYLEELANRCMVQVSQRDYTGMGIKTCRIHDLMRDMCVLMARKENFLGISEHYHENIVARRIAVHPKISPDSDQLHSITLMPSNSRHRSFFYFLKEQRYEMKFDHRSLNFDECRLLRVLNLWGLKVEYIPNEIGDLIHLRYLGLRNTKVSMEAALPTSIGNLRSLCTLDVRNNQSLRLPDVVWKLKNLRHLFVDLLKILENCRMDTLRNLETLKWAHPASLIRKNAMHKLTNLRNIAIGFNKREEIDLVMKSPIFLKGSLHSLNILARESSFPSLEPLSHCQSLKKLELRGEIPEHPSSLHHNLEFLPVSLNKLILSNSGLNQDPMSFLQKLPNLSFLYLEDKSYKGTKMGCSAHGFPQLETLKLEGLGVQEWKIEEGAMPCLKILHLEKLQELEIIPEGIEFITKLRELKVINMKEKFARKIQVIDGVEGEDFDKVKHIPSISVSTTI